jgi:hypothetical protein
MFQGRGFIPPTLKGKLRVLTARPRIAQIPGKEIASVDGKLGENPIHTGVGGYAPHSVCPVVENICLNKIISSTSKSIKVTQSVIKIKPGIICRLL